MVVNFITVVKEHLVKMRKVIANSYIIGTLLWYFTYYCAPIANGKLTLGVAACVLFGASLLSLINTLNVLAEKAYVPALVNSACCGYFAYTSVLILLVLERKPPLTFPVACPFGLNVHLVVPVFMAASFIIAITIAFILYTFDRRN